jgi:hypothetical protein
MINGFKNLPYQAVHIYWIALISLPFHNCSSYRFSNSPQFVERTDYLNIVRKAISGRIHNLYITIREPAPEAQTFFDSISNDSILFYLNRVIDFSEPKPFFWKEVLLNKDNIVSIDTEEVLCSCDPGAISLTISPYDSLNGITPLKLDFELCLEPSFSRCTFSLNNNRIAIYFPDSISNRIKNHINRYCKLAIGKCESCD